ASPDDAAWCNRHTIANGRVQTKKRARADAYVAAHDHTGCHKAIILEHAMMTNVRAGAQDSSCADLHERLHYRRFENHGVRADCKVRPDCRSGGNVGDEVIAQGLSGLVFRLSQAVQLQEAKRSDHCNRAGGKVRSNLVEGHHWQPVSTVLA